MNWAMVAVIEVLVIVNVFLVMVFTTFLVDIASKHISTAIVFVRQKSYDIKKNYLLELSKLKVDDEEEQVGPGRRKFN